MAGGGAGREINGAVAAGEARVQRGNNCVTRIARAGRGISGAVREPGQMARLDLQRKSGKNSGPEEAVVPKEKPRAGHACPGRKSGSEFPDGSQGWNSRTGIKAGITGQESGPELPDGRQGWYPLPPPSGGRNSPQRHFQAKNYTAIYSGRVPPLLSPGLAPPPRPSPGRVSPPRPLSPLQPPIPSPDPILLRS